MQQSVMKSYSNPTTPYFYIVIELGGTLHEAVETIVVLCGHCEHYKVCSRIWNRRESSKKF